MKNIVPREKNTLNVKYWVDSVLNCNKYSNISYWVLCTLHITYHNKQVGAILLFDVRHTVHMKYKKTYSLRIHEQIHIGEKIDSCMFCDEKLSHSTALKFLKPYSCPNCDKKFAKSRSLKVKNKDQILLFKF